VLTVRKMQMILLSRNIIKVRKQLVYSFIAFVLTVSSSKILAESLIFRDQ
jgi:hypothetical protein